jgi:hypothetical protein
MYEKEVDADLDYEDNRNYNELYESKAQSYQEQYRGMLNKYQLLLMQESMVSLNRAFYKLRFSLNFRFPFSATSKPLSY